MGQEGGDLSRGGEVPEGVEEDDVGVGFCGGGKVGDGVGVDECDAIA